MYNYYMFDETGADQESVQTEKKLGFDKLKLDRVLKLTEQVHQRYYPAKRPLLTPHGAREIEVATNLLRKLGIEESWLTKDALAGKYKSELTWHQAIREAEKAIVPNPDATRVLAIRQSNIELHRRTFQARVDFGVDMKDKTNVEVTNDLTASVTRFRNIKSQKAHKKGHPSASGVTHSKPKQPPVTPQNMAKEVTDDLSRVAKGAMGDLSRVAGGLDAFFGTPLSSQKKTA